MTPQLISVQDFAFRGRPLSLLVACAPAGSHLIRFSRRSLHLALQSTARGNETDKTIFTITKNEPLINMLISGSFCSGAKILCPSLLLLSRLQQNFLNGFKRRGMDNSMLCNNGRNQFAWRHIKSWIVHRDSVWSNLRISNVRYFFR